MNTIIKTMLITAGGVLLAGAAMHYGRQLPGLNQAHMGFDS